MNECPPPEKSCDDDGASGVPCDAEALERALKFIDYRPRSVGETIDRMRRYGYSTATSEAVAAHLGAAGLLDDREFGRLFMEELLSKGYGCQRIRTELFKKRLRRDTVEELIASYPDELEDERALEAAGRWKRGQHGDDASRVRRLTSHLMRRGFSGQTARSAARATVGFDTESGPELE